MLVNAIKFSNRILLQDGGNGAFDRKLEFNDSSEIFVSDVKTNRSFENTNDYKTPKL